MVTNKKLLSLLLVFVILLSSANAALAVSAAGCPVNLELFGGTLTGYTQGNTLPTYEQISKDGFSFAGWYTNADFTGKRVFTLPAYGADGATYYARWIVLNADSDDFDSYSATEELLGNWSDWRYPAVSSETTLNTAESHAYSGNSVKICPNEENKSTEIVLQKNINKKGDGFSFWIESENGVKVRVLFNHIKDKSLQSPMYDIPAGRHILAIPWSDINGAAAAEYLWQLSFTVSVPNAADEVYIDSAGTYYTENKISFNTDGGVWIEGYAPPENYIPETALPNAEKIKRDGFTLVGWRAENDTSGECYTVIPETAAGDISYRACWVVMTENYDNFESYNSGAELLNSWSDWKTPAAECDMSLNTDSGNSYSGNSVKICPNEAEKAVQITVSGSFMKNGDGIAFWIKSSHGADVQVKFNNNTRLVSQAVNIPAERRIVTIPWSDISGTENTENLQRLALLISVPNAADAVYIDSLGTYYTENGISFNTDGGVWTEGYTPPEKYVPETALPDCGDIKKDGFNFAGWCESGDISGKSHYVIPADVTGDMSYCAKWITADPNGEFDDFDSYGTNDELLKSWADWKWPAENSEIALNTDPSHAYGGNSLKVSPNAANKNSEVVLQKNLTRTGEGIAFWIESENGATVRILLNHIVVDRVHKSLPSPVMNVSEGKQVVAIPWADIEGAAAAEYLWQLSILVSVPNAADTVYIDSVGTYYADSLRFNTNGGSWADGYTPPKNNVPGTALPAIDDTQKSGFTFGGWYADKEFSGDMYSTVPNTAAGDITYHARWVAQGAGFDNFDSYGTNEALLKSWADWKWPAENSEISLNTDPNHAYGGNSLKVSPNAANKNSEIVLQKNFELTGDGVSFWIESENGAKVRVLFNHIKLQDGTYKSLSSPELNIPGAKQIVAIPWKDIEGTVTADYLWQLSILVSVPNAADAVYIDEVGTYTEPEYEIVHSNWEKGFSDFYDEDGKTVWSYSGSTAVGGEFVGFATDFLTEKNKKYVIAFEYKYLTDGKLDWSLEPQSVGSIFEESLLNRQTDESRETLNSQNRNTDWQVRKTAFAAENGNKYLAFFAKTAAGAVYDISIKNILLYDLGDVDFSGKIDASDLGALKKELLGAESAAEFTDVNNDGYGDVRDLTTLKKMLTNAEQADAEEETSNNPLRRGVNFSGFEFEEEVGYDSWIFDGKYYDIVREKGFDHIRLPVDFFPRMGAAPDYTIDSEFLRKIDTLIDTALNSGLKIVLDFHHFGELQTNVKGNKQKYYKMWEQLSEHYKDYPPELVFELLNEPGNASAISGGGPDVFTPAKILEIQEEAIKIIRRTNPTRLIVHATSWNDGAAQLMSTEPLLPDDENIIMSVHSYEPLTFTHQGADWDGDGIYWPASDFTDDMKDEILDVFKLVKEYHEKYNRPVWVGEFGVFNRITPDGARAKYADFIVDVMKDADCGWCWWEFQMGFRLYSTKYDEWVDDALMAALLK